MAKRRLRGGRGDIVRIVGRAVREEVIVNIYLSELSRFSFIISETIKLP